MNKIKLPKGETFEDCVIRWIKEEYNKWRNTKTNSQRCRIRKWAVVRKKEVLKKQNYTCQVCGSRRKLQLHHDRYEYNLDCVRLLCRPCHTQLHIELNTKT